MPMYNLIEYSDNHSITSGRLWQYYIYYPIYNIAESESFECKIKITGKSPADSNTKALNRLPIKYLSNF